MQTDATNRPAGRPRKEFHGEDIPLAQKPDLDLSLSDELTRGESLVNPISDKALNSGFIEELAFMEDPVMIRIDVANTNIEYPETHVPCQVGNEHGHRGAEVLMNGKWVSMTWIPVGEVITVKRKYVEVLARSVVETVRTVHDDANVEKPRNTVRRLPSSQYPLSIIEDKNPRGHEWLTRIRMGH